MGLVRVSSIIYEFNFLRKNVQMNPCLKPVYNNDSLRFGHSDYGCSAVKTYAQRPLKVRLKAHVFTVGDQQSERLNRDISNRVYCFEQGL